MIKASAFALSMLLSTISTAPTSATPIPAHFESMGEDRLAIETLLSEYTAAVSTKDQRRFEALLLNKNIPFSGVPLSSARGAAPVTQDYDSFRKGVFEGAPFKQRFQDVIIQQDGALAEVSLVFVNTTAKETTWGWKTMQLLKIDGRWKIASEFYTGHA